MQTPMMAPVDLHAVAALIGASLLFTVLSGAIYRRDPSRRKLFLAILALALLAAPWWTAAGLWTWPVGVEDPRRWSLAAPVPWLALGLWWGVGAALVLRTAVRVIRGRRALGRLPCLADPTLEAEVAALTADGFGNANTGAAGRRNTGRRGVELRAGAMPCASSLGAPLLVLPAEAVGWPAEARRAALCHELAHLARRDDRLMLLVRLTADWYWWMPWLRRLHARYVEAMEESCDDLASRAAGGRDVYVAGLLVAVRRLTGGQATPFSPGWAALLGHSHFGARLERLVARPRPTLDHADGRWSLLWSSLACAVLLTARPAAIPGELPDGAVLLPLRPLPAGEMPPAHPSARVEVLNHLRAADAPGWRPINTTARDPLPVYPAHALQRGIAGTVTVELPARATRGGVVTTGNPTLTSSDSSGTLAAAVKRALTRQGTTDLGAGLGSAVGYDNDIDMPPPGTRLRLRKTYRFVLNRPGAAPAEDPTTPGGTRP